MFERIYRELKKEREAHLVIIEEKKSSFVKLSIFMIKIIGYAIGLSFLYALVAIFLSFGV